MTRWHARYDDIRSGLEQTSSHFFIAMKRGTMSVELFEPDGEDMQTPHAQDEIYIVRAGTAQFEKEGVQVEVGAGDVLFVEAGKTHRFTEFDEQFSTWVVFWGPDGGESNAG